MRAQFNGCIEGTASSLEAHLTQDERERIKRIEKNIDALEDIKRALPEMPALSLREKWFGKSKARQENEATLQGIERRISRLNIESGAIYARQFD